MATIETLFNVWMIANDRKSETKQVDLGQSLGKLPLKTEQKGCSEQLRHWVITVSK